MTGPACLIARILGGASLDLGDVMTYPVIGPAGSLPGCPLVDRLQGTGPERVAELRISWLWTWR